LALGTSANRAFVTIYPPAWAQRTPHHNGNATAIVKNAVGHFSFLQTFHFISMINRHSNKRLYTSCFVVVVLDASRYPVWMCASNIVEKYGF